MKGGLLLPFTGLAQAAALGWRAVDGVLEPLRDADLRRAFDNSVEHLQALRTNAKASADWQPACRYVALETFKPDPIPE